MQTLILWPWFWDAAKWWSLRQTSLPSRLMLSFSPRLSSSLHGCLKTALSMPSSILMNWTALLSCVPRTRWQERVLNTTLPTVSLATTSPASTMSRTWASSVSLWWTPRSLTTTQEKAHSMVSSLTQPMPTSSLQTVCSTFWTANLSLPITFSSVCRSTAVLQKFMATLTSITSTRSAPLQALRVLWTTTVAWNTLTLCGRAQIRWFLMPDWMTSPMKTAFLFLSSPRMLLMRLLVRNSRDCSSMPRATTMLGMNPSAIGPTREPMLWSLIRTLWQPIMSPIAFSLLLHSLLVTTQKVLSRLPIRRLSWTMFWRPTRSTPMLALSFTTKTREMSIQFSTDRLPTMPSRLLMVTSLRLTTTITTPAIRLSKRLTSMVVTRHR